LVERAIVLLGTADGEQPLVEDVADAWREPEAQRRAESEDMRGIYLDTSRGIVRIDANVIERLAEFSEEAFDALCGASVAFDFTLPTMDGGIVGEAKLYFVWSRSRGVYAGVVTNLAHVR
jgi:hypothetical protein